MKRVKKRVIQRQADTNQEQANQPHLEPFTNNHNQTLPSQTKQNNSFVGPPPLPVPKPQIQNSSIYHATNSEINQAQAYKASPSSIHPGGGISSSPISAPENFKSVIQSSPSVIIKQDNQNGGLSAKTQQDEKKARIEMLKQKYLKKNPEKPQQRVDQTETKISDKKQFVSNLQIEKGHPDKKATTQLVNEVKITTSEFQPNKLPANKSKNMEIIQEAPVQNFGKPSHQLRKPFTKEKQSQAQNQIQQNSRNEKIKDIQQNLVQQVDTEVKKILQQQNKTEIQEPTIKTSQNINQKKVTKIPPPPPIKKNKNKVPPPPIKQQIKSAPQQKEIDRSDPEEQCNNNSAEAVVTAPISFVPPPPSRVGKSPLVQEILLKKLQKSQIKPSQPSQSLQQTAQLSPEQPILITKKIEMKIDQEFQQKKQQRTILSPNKKIKNLSLEEKVRLWIDSPLFLLEELQFVPPSVQCGKEPCLTSKNPGFSPSLNQFICQFVLKNTNGLTAGQKEALYSLSLEYFFGSGEQLSVEMLILLVKIGQPYLQKHTHFFQSNTDLESYLFSLYKYRGCLNQGELASAVNFFIEKRQITQKQAVILLLLSPTEKIQAVLQARPHSNFENIVTLLSAIQITRKDNGLIIGLYLKLMSLLLQTALPQTILEAILKHVGQFQPNQKYYNIHKQLKLRIISLISSASNTVQKPQQANKQQGKSQGLIGYWSKAVDKLKTATTQFTSVESKAPSKPVPKQEEQKEDDIVYDPILKRYLINGKVPDDEDSKQGSSTSKTPPPPPRPLPVGKQTVTPPPPVGNVAKKKVNRYT